MVFGRHGVALASLVAALAGCGGRGCSNGASTRNTRTPTPRVDAAAVAQTPAVIPGALALGSYDASVEEVLSVRQGASRLAGEVYGRLRATAGNLVFSPGALTASMAMLSGGARNDTLAEMRRVLHLPSDDRAVHALVGPASRGWRAGDAGDGGDGGLLRFAHRVFITGALRFDPTYGDLTMHAYQSSAEHSEFAEPVRATMAINNWLTGQTEERVDAVLPEGVLTRDARVVVASAMHVGVAWRQRFNPALTRAEPFQGARAAVSMMHGAQLAGYVANDDVQLVELPMRDAGLVVDLMLPGQRSSFDALEANLAGGKFEGWTGSLAPARVDVALPRFAMRPESAAYAEVLQGLGMRLAFDPAHADFSGIGAGATPAENPALTMVYQRVSLAVSEVGGDGSINAPMPGMGDAGVRPGGAVAVRFDRPFLFAVRDPQSGLVLLLGRVVDPGA